MVLKEDVGAGFHDRRFLSVFSGKTPCFAYSDPLHLPFPWKSGSCPQQGCRQWSSLTAACREKRGEGACGSASPPPDCSIQRSYSLESCLPESWQLGFLGWGWAGHPSRGGHPQEPRGETGLPGCTLCARWSCLLHVPAVPVSHLCLSGLTSLFGAKSIYSPWAWP